MSLRSTTTFSSGQIYCCFTRCLSGRCSMLKEIPLLRAPENNRTGIEISPKVKCPDQTEAAIVPSRKRSHLASKAALCHPEEAESPAKRETPDEGPMQLLPASPDQNDQTNDY